MRFDINIKTVNEYIIEADNEDEAWEIAWDIQSDPDGYRDQHEYEYSEVTSVYCFDDEEEEEE